MKSNLNLKDIQAVVSDMDGVLWHGPIPMPGLANFFEFLNSRAIPIVLASNNSTTSPAQYRQKLADWGITLPLEHVLTCTLTTVAYLKRKIRQDAAVYVVGEENLCKSIQAAGFRLCRDTVQPADAVVVGGDRTLTYDKLKSAGLLIRGGAQFVGTNPDVVYPTEEGLVPEAGTILAALQAATGVRPVIMGKPEPALFDMAVEIMGSRRQQTVMLGDRLDTDILGAKRARLKTILLTTGVDDEAAISQKGIVPDAVFNGLEQLVHVWQKGEAADV
jgi:4-nitrophenyl phosphatase